jgi:hypothetical protein
MAITTLRVLRFLAIVVDGFLLAVLLLSFFRIPPFTDWFWYQVRIAAYFAFNLVVLWMLLPGREATPLLRAVRMLAVLLNAAVLAKQAIDLASVFAGSPTGEVVFQVSRFLVVAVLIGLNLATAWALGRQPIARAANPPSPGHA